jgi:hypothetical protein
MKQLQAIFKADNEEQQIVWAEVYAPGIPDTDGEFMDAETIRKMAYKFMEDHNQTKVDLRHNNKLVKGACMVETFIARKGDPTFIEGSWVAGVHVPDRGVWHAIKSGEINGFSMEAFVHKRSVEIDIEIPDVIGGKTFKHDDGHEHQFNVRYDDKGNFLGGTTDEVNGHSHVIKRGTITEHANGHNHRFSFIDLLGTIPVV